MMAQPSREGETRRGQRRAPQARRAPVFGGLFGLTLDRRPGAPPLYRQVCDGVSAAMLEGALTAGMRLPPERQLAAALGVNRTTIMHAYQELAADGVVEARPGRGAVVSIPAAVAESLGDERAWGGAPAQPAWLLGLPPLGNGELGATPGLLRDMAAFGVRDDLISFASGVPSHDLIPLDALQASLREGLARHGAAGLSYGPVEGLEELRVAVAAHMAARGVAVAPDEILALAGATQGISLAARALIEPGDEVVVESPTYIGGIQTFGAAGARLIGVPMDDDGMRVDVLASILTRRRVRLILTQPTIHNPTGVTMSQARRERLLALARRHGVPILEDDAYGELWHREPAPQPLKALDRAGLVLYLGTFSKSMAPGLRVGWLAAPSAVIARLALAKQFSDLNTATPSQLMAAGFLASGDYGRHLARVRAVYAERRAAMLASLAPAAPYLEPSTGSRDGFYLWCRLAAGRRARLLAAAAMREGVAILPGDAFYPPGATDDGQDRVRLSFSGAGPVTIAAGIGRLLPLLQRLSRMGDADNHARSLSPVV